MKKKIIFLIGIITVILGIFLLTSSKENKDFVYVIPKIKNFEVLETNIGKYQLISLDNPSKEIDIEQKKFLNGSLFYNVPNGNYLLQGEYAGETETINFIKSKDWEKIQIGLEGMKFSKHQEIFLNILTVSLIILNLLIFTGVKDRFRKNNDLKIIFILLISKMLLSFRGSFQTDFFILVEYILTRLLLYLLIFYFLNNIINKRYKKFRVFIWISLAIIYVYNFLFVLMIYSPQFYVHLIESHSTFLNVIRLIRKTIDLTRIIFIISIFEFLNKKREIPKSHYLYWFIIGISYFILEFFHEIFPTQRNLYYFIELMEIVFIFWWLVFNSLKSYTKQTTRVIRYILGVTLAYISLFYFKSLTEPTVILLTIIILDFYTTTINQIMSVKNEVIEKIYNRMCLTQNIKTFEMQLRKEILRNINTIDIKVKVFIDFDEYKKYIIDQADDNIFISKEYLLIDDYDLAFRIEFNENRYIGAIFVKEKDNSLSFEEHNFLLELSNKIASAMSQVRINSLYTELI
ncbi:hypothetical protein [Cetobacterium sp.]|uniref:hypothetical protein n=1 Tax=Cetobacterium sp. TaxID=2071632 RepID=UPI002FC66CAA